MSQHYDLIVIGAGPAGYECAAIGANDGLKTLLVERDHLGGTCLNRGCIPTKTLCRSAQVAADVAHAATYGIDTDGGWRADMAAIIERKNHIVAQLREAVDMVTAKCEKIFGTARITGPDSVEVDGQTFTASRIVVATGSEPASLPIPGAGLCVDSDTLLDTTTLPDSMVVIGGGVIGLEFASIFNALGTKVTLVEYAPEILPAFDRDIAKRLRSLLKSAGIEIVTGACVTAVAKTDGSDLLTVDYEAKGKPRQATASTVLMAVGRRPLLPEGITRDMLTPESLQIPGTSIYAIGDCNGRCLLAHAASAQAKAVMGKAVNPDVIPAAVFTMPEVATVGLTEQQCADKGLDFTVAKGTFRSNGKALAMGEADGMIKVMLAPDRTLLGCHIIGPHAADLIAEPALAMANGLTADALMSTIHTHPTLCEAMIATLR